jgi:hypothetical protein
LKKFIIFITKFNFNSLKKSNYVHESSIDAPDLINEFETKKKDLDPTFQLRSELTEKFPLPRESSPTMTINIYSDRELFGEETTIEYGSLDKLESN